MSDIDRKKDAILEGLYFYYNQFSYSNEVYRFTGEKEGLSNEFIPPQLLSAWLAFSKKGDFRFLDSAKLFDF